MVLNLSVNFEDANDGVAPTLTRSIIGTLNYVLFMTVGNGLCVLIIDFERFGGDPQKRTLINQMISFNFMCLIVQAIIAGSIAEVVTLTGPVGETWTAVFISAHFGASMASLLSLVEQLGVRCLISFAWKNLSHLNDDFFGLFLKLFNLMITLELSAIFIMLDFHINRENVRLTGIHRSLIPSTRRSYILVPPLILIVISVIGCIILNIKKSQLQSNDQSVYQDQQSGNNNTENKAVTSTTLLCIMGLFTLAINRLVIRADFVDRSFTDNYRDIITFFTMNFLFPFVIVAKNKEIQAHGRDRINDLIHLLNDVGR